MKGFHEIPAEEYVGKCAEKINPDWMLLTAGAPNAIPATMTISFGAFGFMWGKHLALCVVRHSRHTLPFVLDNNRFSLAFFDPSWKEKLLWCGRHSGKDNDKIAYCGFHTVFVDGVPFFEESAAVLICSLMYKDDIKKSGFINQEIFAQWYGHGVHKDDMHDALYGAIDKVLIRD